MYGGEISPQETDDIDPVVGHVQRRSMVNSDWLWWVE